MKINKYFKSGVCFAAAFSLVLGCAKISSTLQSIQKYIYTSGTEVVADVATESATAFDTVGTSYSQGSYNLREYNRRGGNFVPPEGMGHQFEQSQTLEDSGITGSDLSFDTTYYPYFGMLTEAQQGFYKQIYANISQMEAVFVPVTSITTDDICTVIEAVYKDHPEIFWLDTDYTYKYNSSGKVVQVTLQFNDLALNIDSTKAAFDAAAQEIINAASSLSSTTEKEKYVHDAIINNNTYSKQAEYNQSAYSALVSGKTVCAGYSRAFQYIMTQLGVPTYFVVGTVNGYDHSWNVVYVDGVYRNVDLTWDDTDPISYEYFNVTDDKFNGERTLTELSVNIPKCS